jgi:hypothetical protein
MEEEDEGKAELEVGRLSTSSNLALSDAARGKMGQTLFAIMMEMQGV